MSITIHLPHWLIPAALGFVLGAVFGAIAMVVFFFPSYDNI